MKTNSKLLLCFFSIIFSFSIRAQYIEVLAQNNFGANIGTYQTASGGVYILAYISFNYAPSLTSTKKEIITVEYHKLKYSKVIWNKKDNHFTVIETKIEGENLIVLGYTSLDEKTYFMRYTFNKGVLIDETIVHETNKLFNGGLINFSKTGERIVLMDFDYVWIDKKKTEEYSQSLNLVSFNKQFEFIENTEVKLVNIKKKGEEYLSPNDDQWSTARSAILLDDGTIILNINKQLFVRFDGETSILPFNFEVENEINSYRILPGVEKGLVLVGTYKKEDKYGMAVIEFDEELVAINQVYEPFDNDFSKSFYELSAQIKKVENTSNEKFDDFKPYLEDVVVDSDGTIRAVFIGSVSKMGQIEFRSNLNIVGFKNDKILYQKIVPYVYDVVEHIAFGGQYVRVYFDEKSTTVLYPDYKENYNASFEFVPATKNLPYRDRPYFCVVKYNYESETYIHKLLEIKVKDGIKFNDQNCSLSLNGTVLEDGSYEASFDEWGAMTLKASYIGRIVIP